MLFWRFLFVLIFTAFPGMAHDSCGEGESKCMRMTPDLMNFPDTAEKMKERCSAFKSMVECGISHQETCPNDSAFSIKPIFEPLLERINKFCDETDIWFKGENILIFQDFLN
nr:uncharacterized protein LOC107454626 [Parasteatoda tepidariorum]